MNLFKLLRNLKEELIQKYAHTTHSLLKRVRFLAHPIPK